MIKTLLSALFCAFTLGTTVPLTRRLATKFSGLVVNQTIDSAVAQRLQLQSYLTEELTPDWQKAVLPSASSVVCTETLDQVKRIETSFQTLVEDPMAQLDAHGTAIQVRIEDLHYLEEQLVDLHEVLGDFAVLTKFTLGKIPFVGPVFIALSKSLTAFRNGVVKTMRDQVRTFNGRVLNKTEPLLETMLTQNAALAEKLAIAKFVLYEHAVKPLCAVDEYCPRLIRETVCTERVTGQLKTIATHLEDFTERLDDMAEFVHDLDDILLRVSGFLQTPGYKNVMRFFAKLADELKPFTQFLDKTISIRISVPDVCAQVPCGVKMCGKKRFKYPCGAKMCRVCTPQLSIVEKFTVRQIANGLGALTDLFMDAVQKLLPDMPDLTIPGFPELPGLPLLDVPVFDLSLDLPTLGLGCLSGGRVETNNHGIPRGMNLETCFHALPAIHC